MIQCFSDLADPRFSDPSDPAHATTLLTPGGSVDAETATGDYPVTFHSGPELSRLQSRPLALAPDEPISIGRGWLLRVVRERRAACLAPLERAAS